MYTIQQLVKGIVFVSSPYLVASFNFTEEAGYADFTINKYNLVDSYDVEKGQ